VRLGAGGEIAYAAIAWVSRHSAGRLRAASRIARRRPQRMTRILPRPEWSRSGTLTAEVLMLRDLAALTPPLLVAAAFLIAAGAFIRNEMRRGKNETEDARSADSPIDSSAEPGINGPDPGSAKRSFSDASGDHGRDPGA
jgi:hypothetical protein